MFDGILSPDGARVAVAQPISRQRIKNGHPLMIGGLGCWLFNDADAGGAVRNLIAPRWELQPTSSPVFGTSQEGIGPNIADNGSACYTTTVGQLDGLTSGPSITLSWRFRNNAPPSGDRTMVAIHDNTPGDIGVFFLRYVGATVHRVGIPWLISLADFNVADATGQIQTWTVTRSGSSWKIWVNDAEVLSLTDSSSFGTSTNHSLTVGAWPGIGTSHPALWHDFFIGARPWTRDEHIQRWLDPWGHLESESPVVAGSATSPPPPPLWFPLSAGGNPPLARPEMIPY